eukprot:1380232-Pleurochrysis_carterae.AAC.2
MRRETHALRARATQQMHACLGAATMRRWPSVVRVHAQCTHPNPAARKILRRVGRCARFLGVARAPSPDAATSGSRVRQRKRRRRQWRQPQWRCRADRAHGPCFAATAQSARAERSERRPKAVSDNTHGRRFSDRDEEVGKKRRERKGGKEKAGRARAESKGGQGFEGGRGKEKSRWEQIHADIVRGAR